MPSEQIYLDKINQTLVNRLPIAIRFVYKNFFKPYKNLNSFGTLGPWINKPIIQCVLDNIHQINFSEQEFIDFIKKLNPHATNNKGENNLILFLKNLNKISIKKYSLKTIQEIVGYLIQQSSLNQFSDNYLSALSVVLFNFDTIGDSFITKKDLYYLIDHTVFTFYPQNKSDQNPQENFLRLFYILSPASNLKNNDVFFKIIDNFNNKNNIDFICLKQQILHHYNNDRQSKDAQKILKFIDVYLLNQQINNALIKPISPSSFKI